MTKNAKTISFAAIGAVVLIVGAYMAIDLYLPRPRRIDCGDGPTATIDIRDFVTQYSAYSVELEGSIAGKGKVSINLNPVQVTQISEALQSANEFRKYVVAGYNSCAITQAQYGEDGKWLARSLRLECRGPHRN